MERFKYIWFGMARKQEGFLPYYLEKMEKNLEAVELRQELGSSNPAPAPACNDAKQLFQKLNSF